MVKIEESERITVALIVLHALLSNPEAFKVITINQTILKSLNAADKFLESCDD